MKNFTSTLAVAAMALGLASISAAQAAGPVGGAPVAGAAKAKHEGVMKVERSILEKLNLSKDQMKQLKGLFKETRVSMKAARDKANETLDKGAIKSKMQEVLKGYHTGLEHILTPDQMKQYEELHKEVRANRKAGKAINPNG